MRFETIIRAWAVLGVLFFSVFMLITLVPDTSPLVEILAVLSLFAGIILFMVSISQLILMLIKPREIKPVDIPPTSSEPETTQN